MSNTAAMYCNLICVQPSILYYAWQVEVMLENFIELGIDKRNTIQLLWAYNTNESDWEQKVAVIKRLEAKHSGNQYIQFHYYQDTRVYPISYISSIRPNVLKQHFRKYPYLQHEKVFYHDCDIVFTKYPQFLHELDVSGTQWFVSDTISYIGHDYILSKGGDVLDKMCQIVGCHPFFIKARQAQSGGCQYLFSNVDWVFFDKMERDCERLFAEITALNNRKQALAPQYHELQIWCADMWAMLWGAWMRGFETTIVPELGFVWATDPITAWEDGRYIFHNAGVTQQGDFFYKNAYQNRTPYGHIAEEMGKLSPNAASYKYAELVLKTAKNSCLL